MSALGLSLPDHLDLIAAAPEGIKKLRGVIVAQQLVPRFVWHT